MNMKARTAAKKDVESVSEPGKTPENLRILENPATPQPPLEVRTIRRTFARSLCSAHHMATFAERETCNDGIPCTKSADCLSLADKTLAYLEYRNRLPKDP